jgi:hypothetical protein
MVGGKVSFQKHILCVKIYELFIEYGQMGVKAYG